VYHGPNASKAIYNFLCEVLDFQEISQIQDPFLGRRSQFTDFTRNGIEPLHIPSEKHYVTVAACKHLGTFSA
jgi:hypothetical protein